MLRAFVMRLRGYKKMGGLKIEVTRAATGEVEQHFYPMWGKPMGVSTKKG